MSPIQYLLLSFFIYAIAKVVWRYHSAELSAGWTIFWILFWLSAGVAAFLPESTSHLAQLVKVGRGSDLVIYAALAAIFFLIFKLIVKLEKINKEITNVVRKEALNDKK